MYSRSKSNNHKKNLRNHRSRENVYKNHLTTEHLIQMSHKRKKKDYYSNNEILARSPNLLQTLGLVAERCTVIVNKMCFHLINYHFYSKELLSSINIFKYWCFTRFDQGCTVKHTRLLRKCFIIISFPFE